jgi:hypothetical protein
MYSYLIKFGSCWTLVVPGIELLVAPAEIMLLLLPTCLAICWLVGWVIARTYPIPAFGLGFTPGHRHPWRIRLGSWPRAILEWVHAPFEAAKTAGFYLVQREDYQW